MDLYELLGKLNLAERGVEEEEQGPPREPLLSSFDLEGVAERIRSGQARNVVVMAGAGISVSAGTRTRVVHQQIYLTLCYKCKAEMQSSFPHHKALS